MITPAADSIPTRTIDPHVLAERLASGEAWLIDVREPGEFASEHIPGAAIRPLSQLDAAALDAERAGRRIVFCCRSGVRSARAAAACLERVSDAACLTGGVNAWKDAGLPTERTRGAPRLDIMRQVQLIAGGLVVAGVALGATISPWFLALSGAVGAGLMFAGATGWCGLARLLGRAPWNRVPASCRTPQSI